MPVASVAAEKTIEEILVSADFRSRSDLETATSVTVMTEAAIDIQSGSAFRRAGERDTQRKLLLRL